MRVPRIGIRRGDGRQLDLRGLARLGARRQARLAASNVLDALAPSNYAWSNPAVIKETVDQGGVNLARGARRFAEDFPHLPATVDTTKFAVGENLAVTKGSVVLRTEVFELIQYAPQTKEVREVG